MMSGLEADAFDGTIAARSSTARKRPETQEKPEKKTSEIKETFRERDERVRQDYPGYTEAKRRGYTKAQFLT